MISEEHNKEGKKHQKHAKLVRPAFGNYGRNEWAIVGGPCTTIKFLADQVISALSPDYKCAYIDTTHNDDVTLMPAKLANGAFFEYNDQVNYTQLNYNGPFNSFKLRETFAAADLVLANGNHNPAKAQVVIIYENKKASLQKRVEQLSNVQMILLADNAAELFDFIKEAVPYWNELPVYRLDETEKIVDFFRKQLHKAKPKLNGLVLAGGKSERMGFDKGSVNWHGKEQRYHMADLLNPFCEEVFISCRPDQQFGIVPPYLSLPDTFLDLGPYGAILSAFRERPDEAWLVVACDLPLLTEKSLGHLVENRNVATNATAYQSSFNDFPEPLITIWEPKSYPVLLSFLAQGYSCPRKVLINSDITLLNAPDPEELTNVNTPEELEKAKLALQ
ncbi:NTP transferase domain-containing protein [Mucilaginibacter gotjawali]|uniref:NTP transferase domain-containing protein n=1 Tax=Mucilaginibacter gotjawali TaxID=1550579 RepID=UPI0018D515AB|nr:NTP transferase domain-containing protein [Mucilaginibacter gotjawali]